MKLLDKEIRFLKRMQKRVSTTTRGRVGSRKIQIYLEKGELPAALFVSEPEYTRLCGVADNYAVPVGRVFNLLT